MKDKIYIINDDCIWKDECYSNIVSVTDNKDIAINLLKDYVKKVKEEIDFDSLEATQETLDTDSVANDFDWIYSETETHFEVYQYG